MRFTTRSRPHVCLPCQINLGRSSFTTRSFQHARLRIARTLLGSSVDRINAQNLTQGTVADSRRWISRQGTGPRDAQEKGTTPGQPAAPKIHFQNPYGLRTPTRKGGPTDGPSIELSGGQQDMLRRIHELNIKLSQGMSQVPEVKKDFSIVYGIPIETAFQTLPLEGYSTEQRSLMEQIRSVYNGQSFGKVRDELALVSLYRDRARCKVTDPAAHDVLARLRVVDKPEQKAGRSTNLGVGASADSGGRRRKSLSSMVSFTPLQKQPLQQATSKSQPKPFPAGITKADMKTVASSDLTLAPIEMESSAEVPQLSHDLPRVLFNPGVYQLRDPRSRVYNFDPYLEHIMPVSEFNFEALTPYRTSSEDKQLMQIARAHGKRYIGSSSSMTAILSHFHFLISFWRSLHVKNFSRGFEEQLTTFTNLNKSPSAIFLRYRDGVYAVDADKELDEPNILMSLGKSMEKLLTLDTDKFEKWRRSNAATNTEPLGDLPDVFHYSQQGRFLLRSQLDAQDPRLPGTGYFDLKTRAVAGIRMNLREHETGMGYQIKELHGNWESYEREYYDMMRSTFLKYSLQARMGNMDGIFVAYHNISRIFGFQYIPLEEMDLTLHGQNDTCLGDQEFRFSINFLEEIFNIATEKYPQRSLRIHFETRDASTPGSKPYMDIFIEAMNEDDIMAIQNSQKAAFEAFERRFLSAGDVTPVSETELAAAAGEETVDESEVAQEKDTGDATLPVNTIMSRPVGPASSGANTEFLANILDISKARGPPKVPPKEVTALKLSVQNKINDKPVIRPTSIGSAARWTIDYQLERRSDEEARKLYTLCKNKRKSALQAVMNRSGNDYFIRSIRELSERGAEWQKQQDELDAKRERVVLYGK